MMDFESWWRKQAKEVGALNNGTFLAAICEGIAQMAWNDSRKKYHELLYAVESAHPGESRHETALRYIMERESNKACGAGKEKDGE